MGREQPAGRGEDSPANRSPNRPDRGQRWLARFALGRPDARAWALYDWANSAAYTVIVTAIFPIFFHQVAASGLPEAEKIRAFAWATTLSLASIAVLGPILGVLGDIARIKKALFSVFVVLGASASIALYWIGPGDALMAAVLFGLVNAGLAGSFVFYDALLTTVARADELDRLSSSAYALGYLGGGLALLVSVAIVLSPASFGIAPAEPGDLAAASLPTRLTFLFVGVWWLVFSIPFLRHVREPELARGAAKLSPWRAVVASFSSVALTARHLGRHRHALLFLVAFLIYGDGIGTVIRMATTFGAERGLARETMILAIVAVQAIGIPGTLLFGWISARLGAKRAILIALAGYVGICFLAHGMSSTGEFVALACLVGLVQGGAQSLSRSLYASLIPKHETGRFFGLFATLEKFAGIVGPLVFSVSTKSSHAILALLGFFVVGAILLALVDVEAGRRSARAAERDVEPERP